MGSSLYHSNPFADASFQESTMASETLSLRSVNSALAAPELARREAPRPQKVRLIDVTSMSSDLASPFTDDNAETRRPTTSPRLPTFSRGHDATEMKPFKWGTSHGRKNSTAYKKNGVNRPHILKRLFSLNSLKKIGLPLIFAHLRGAGSPPKSNDTLVANESFLDGSADPNDESLSTIKEDGASGEEVPKDPKDRKSEERVLAFNNTLPLHLLDAEGFPTTTYPRNKIRTAKYTPLSFFPKNVWGQFSRDIANVYFLLLIILGAFSIFGVPSPGMAAVPLIFIVCLTALKDAIEDSQRTAQDMEINNKYTHILTQVCERDGYVFKNHNVCDRSVSVWRKFKKWNTRQLFRLVRFVKRVVTNDAHQARVKAADASRARKSFDSIADVNRHSMASNTHKARHSGLHAAHTSVSQVPHVSGLTKTMAFSRKRWKEVRVGDVIRVHNNEEVPADMLILLSSDDDNCCFVETRNLDGETNMKVKQALKLGDRTLRCANDYMDLEFQVESEGPHPCLYLYQGVVSYRYQGQIEREAVSINNMMLRGCYVRSTRWITGIVVFTGQETKIMLNLDITASKKSRLSRELNYYVLVNFIILFLICFTAGLVSGLSYTSKRTSREYFEFGTITRSPAIAGLVNFFVAVIMYQSLVPISLYITIEIIKLIQAYFIHRDVGLYYKPLDLPCSPKSWSISDDLGQVEYIFSDKTGTLTQNIMEFKKCTIQGVQYGRAYTEALEGLRRRQGIDTETEGRDERERIALDRADMLAALRAISPNIYTDDLTIVSKQFVGDLTGALGAAQKAATEEFMLALSLCHSVLLEQDPKNSEKLLLKAQSPDEAALVGTARSLGFEFCEKTKRGYAVRVQGDRREYQVLNTLEFNSTRKRMSAIVRMPGSEPRIVLFCKGADSVIYSRLLPTQNSQAMLDTTSRQLEGFATEGLRTLCIARRELTWEQYQEFNARYSTAAASLTDREARMEEVADSIERELVLLGGTAIEDRLQDGVPESISILAQARIKLWVLTGDKVETAINIGFSCNLLGNDMDLLIVKTDLLNADLKAHGLKPGDPAEHVIGVLLTLYLQQHFAMSGTQDELEAAKGDHLSPSQRFGVVIDGDALRLALADPMLQRKFLLLCKQCKAVLCCRVSPAQKAAVVRMVKDLLDVITLAIGDGSNDVAMIQTADVGVGLAGEEGRQAAMSSDYVLGQFRFMTRLLLTHGRWSYKRFSAMIPCFFYKNINYTFAQFWYSFFNGFDGIYIMDLTYLILYQFAFTSLPVIALGVFDQDVSAKVLMLTPQLYRTGILRSEFTESKFWAYLADGVYQSLVAFFFPYFAFLRTFQEKSGIMFDHRFSLGVFVTAISCSSSNIYVFLRQYRWDWVSFVAVAASIFMVIIWTFVWTAGLWSSEFYQMAEQVYPRAVYWLCVVVGICVCLMPLFFYEVVQKLFFPRDCDIVRERVHLGAYDAYPDKYDPTDPDRQVVVAVPNEADLENQPVVSDVRQPEPRADLPSLARDPAMLQMGQTKSVYHDNSSIIDEYDGDRTCAVMLDDPVELRNLRVSEGLERVRTNIRLSLEFDELTNATSLRRSMDELRQ